jgi:beta-glucanase (GH16 family)
LLNLNLNYVPQGVQCDGVTKYYEDGFITSMTPGGGGNLFGFTYGFAEARLYLPGGNSGIYNYPSWWLQDENDGGGGSQYTEIDIVEGLDATPEWHVHGAGSDTDCAGSPTNQESNTGSWVGWHTFGVDWSAGKATFYYDGNVVGSTCYTGDLDSGPAGALRLILSVSPGNINDSGDILSAPSDVQASYARVWE